MDEQIVNQYAPDVVSPPGETLAETLDTRHMSQAELAERTGRPKKTINEIINGKAVITPETALQLERVLGVPADFWNARERQYRAFLAHQAETRQLATQVDWLTQVPIAAMTRLGWITHYDDQTWQLREVLQFFGIATPQQWNRVSATFRKSPAFAANEMALSVWLRRGEQDATALACAPYWKERFMEALEAARMLTTEAPAVFQPRLKDLCAACGVAVVFVPELPKTRVSGAARWLAPDKAVIQLSLRYKTNDHLWFTFFHEAGHILKHGKSEPFLDIDTIDTLEGTDKETEANAFAADILIPPDAWHRFLATCDYRAKAAIRAFAADIGIAPGIVVGRLQHEQRIAHTHCNDLKIRLSWDTHTPR